MKTPNKVIKYQGFFITRLFPSGYYETYLGEGLGFFKADTLKGIKNQILILLIVRKNETKFISQ